MKIDLEIPSVCWICLREGALVVIIPDPQKQREHLKQVHDIDPFNPAEFFRRFREVYSDGTNWFSKRDELAEVVTLFDGVSR